VTRKDLRPQHPNSVEFPRSKTGHDEGGSGVGRDFGNDRRFVWRGEAEREK